MKWLAKRRPWINPVSMPWEICNRSTVMSAMEGQLRSAQGKLRQDEQNKNNASRDHERRRELMGADERCMISLINRATGIAIQRRQEPADQFAAQVEKASGDANLGAQLKQAQEQLAKDLAALTALRGKLNESSASFNPSSMIFLIIRKPQVGWIRMGSDSGDIRLLENFSRQRSRVRRLRKTTGDLTRERTDRQNRIRAAKGEMDRALTILNQPWRSIISESPNGTAIKRFEAARNLEDSENTRSVNSTHSSV